MSRFGLIPFSHPLGSVWREPRDIWDVSPSRLFDQHFGRGLCDDDMMPPTLYHGFYVRPRQQINRQLSGLSEVKIDGNNFQVSLDVNQFTPNELTVKVVDRDVIVHGKHEEKSDEHGFVKREFTRRYVLPEGVEPEQVSSSLSQDGVLTIEAPLKAIEAPKPNERLVSIVRKDTPAQIASAEEQAAAAAAKTA